MNRPLAALMRDIASYGQRPDRDASSPVGFSELATKFPLVIPSPDGPAIGMAHFAEMGYCPYKSYHRGKGTAEEQSTEGKAALQRGTEYHERREAADRRRAKALPKATKKQLRDPSCNIAEIPEVPASVRVGGMIYMSSIERAGRQGRNLTIREIKTGTFIGGTDHLLQTWGYCISAPSILSSRGFIADRIEWQVEYPKAHKTFGPFTFSERALSLLLQAMAEFEHMHAVGRSNVGTIEVVPVSAARCRHCAFISGCQWAQRSVSHTA